MQTKPPNINTGDVEALREHPQTHINVAVPGSFFHFQRRCSDMFDELASDHESTKV